MKKINIILLGLVLVTAACSTELDQSPPNIASADSLTDFEGVLNAAYNYQTGSATPLAMMGDARADNFAFDESPHNEFNDFDGGLTNLEGVFFRPFYVALYKSILSANNVIANSSNTIHIGEAKFLRGLAYFKLVKVFGEVPVNLSSTPSVTDTSILKRRSVSDVYDVIISDLTDAIGALNNTGVSSGRASQIAAQALLGKVYVQMGDFGNATSYLGDAIAAAPGASVTLPATFAEVFGDDSDLNSEVIFATQISGSIAISEYSSTIFSIWYSGGDSKGDEDPVTMSLLNAFDAAGDTTRKNNTVDVATRRGKKYGYGADQDWIELRLADVILLHAEALNETTNASGVNSTSILAGLDGIRTRAGLGSLSGSALTQATVRTAIANERRLELAFEGQRWFDLVRTSATGVDTKYNVFPIPTSEIFASENVITQNEAY